jgi:hypothetical protein
MERSFFEWLVEQRSYVAFAFAVLFFAATLILRYAYDLWWPWGIVMATFLGVVALFAGSSK